jgi:hypothetical protein
LTYSRSPVFDFQNREKLARKMKFDVQPLLQKITDNLRLTFDNNSLSWENLDNIELNDELFSNGSGGYRDFISCTPQVSRLLWLSPAIQCLREVYQQCGGDSNTYPSSFYQMVIGCLFHSQWEHLFNVCHMFTKHNCGAQLTLRVYLLELEKRGFTIGGGRNARFQSTSIDQEYFFGEGEKHLKSAVHEIHELVLWARRNKPPATGDATFQRLSGVMNLLKGVNEFRIGMLFPLLACSGVLGQAGLTHAGNVWPSKGQAAESYLDELKVAKEDYRKVIHIMNHCILKIPGQRIDIAENVFCEIQRKNEKKDIFYRGQNIYRLTQYGTGFILEEKMYGGKFWFQVFPFLAAVNHDY